MSFGRRVTAHSAVRTELERVPYDFAKRNYMNVEMRTLLDKTRKVKLKNTIAIPIGTTK